LAKRTRMIANHGQSVRYYHDEIGVNSRLDSIQAAILRIKLRHLDSYIAARQKAADAYDKAFAECDVLITPVRAKNSTHVFHQYTLQTKGISRDEIVQFLTDKGIPAMIYYPVPLHLQKAYTDDRYKEGMFPVTEKLCNTVFSLPMHTELDVEQQQIIIDTVLEFASVKN
jgi:UDP-2-acetamido-2-deoxy-ribo-hexuluronate aminotransferase